MIQIAKRIAKRSLQHIAANFGKHTKKPVQPQLLILMYHRILPADDERATLEEPGMMVTPDTFDMHLGLLKQQFEVVSLSTWIQMKKEGAPLPPLACAITFDDGWSDNYEFAFPLLQKHRLPATIFLVSDMIGSKLQFWPERIARLCTHIASNCPQQWQHPSLQWLKHDSLSYTFGDQPPDREQLSQIIGLQKSRSDENIHQLIDSVENDLQLQHESASSLLDWQQMQQMIDTGLVEAGSHTCHHIRLDQQQPEAILSKEISESKVQIEQQLNQDIGSFCYPNGDHSDRAVALVRQNYQCAVSTEKGWNDTESDIHLLRRIGVHEDISADRTAFLACLSGWL